ncbi:MAG: pantoate--beta-alanine ligase [Chloroflexi bacterium]|nr:pantoate--beta-alanine ligase [Chloroflexota bacterium]
MKVVKTISELRDSRRGLKEPVGFVPTMGFLHEGHLSLVRRSREECQSTVVSIFVNPTQFGPQEDLTRYPRDLPRDLAMLEKEGTDLVFVPEAGEIYPRGFQTYVQAEELTKRLEGALRPGHFRGVATVVTILLNIVQPQRAYCGQKDAQQSLVIKRMVQDLNLPLEIVACPTVREEDGLAMSSRNVYLNPQERKAASALSRGLFVAEKAFQDGERDGEQLRNIVRQTLKEEPLARIDYISCADLETLQELQRIERGALLSLAVFIGKTRLIDNVLLGVDSL